MHASSFALDLLGFCLNESEKIVGFEWFLWFVWLSVFFALFFCLFVCFIYKLLAFFFFLGFWIYETMNSILWYIVLRWYGTYKSWVSEGSSQSKYGQLIWDNESSYTYIIVLGCLNDWSVCVCVWSMFLFETSCEFKSSLIGVEK